MNLARILAVLATASVGEARLNKMGAPIEAQVDSGLDALELASAGRKMAAEKVDICHWSEEDQVYVGISVAKKAAAKHLAEHPDGKIGDPVPSGMVFGDDCQPVDPPPATCVPEGEKCLEDGDTSINGGCSTRVPSDFDSSVLADGVTICGTFSGYTTGGWALRDLDEYLYAHGGGLFSVTLEATFIASLFIIEGAPECSPYNRVTLTSGMTSASLNPPITSVTATADLAAGTYGVSVWPGFSTPRCGSETTEYKITLCLGDEPCV